MSYEVPLLLCDSFKFNSGLSVDIDIIAGIVSLQ